MMDGYYPAEMTVYDGTRVVFWLPVGRGMDDLARALGKVLSTNIAQKAGVASFSYVDQEKVA